MSRFGVCEQMYILMLLKSVVYIAFIMGKSLKKTKLLSKHCDLRSCGAHSVWWNNFHRKGGSEPALTDSSNTDDTSDRRPGSGRPKSVSATDKIAVLQDLIFKGRLPQAHTPTKVPSDRKTEKQLSSMSSSFVLHVAKLDPILKRTKECLDESAESGTTTANWNDVTSGVDRQLLPLGYSRTTAEVCVLFYSVSQKNIPDIFSCNSRKHCRIFIMFGTHVTEKASNQ